MLKDKVSKMVVMVVGLSIMLQIMQMYCHDPPNIVFVLFDDVGWADFNYNVGGESAIPTPNLDRLASQGLKLKSHYVHSSCTPSRASLMTGRYSPNTGLPCAMFPGSVAGLPDEMATMPQLLRRAGYSAHMVGKWHIGHAQWKQGPVGRGFESHTGSFMWNLESYSKLMWKNPLETVGSDWVAAYENGSYTHKAEPRHATIAITEEAISRMEEHIGDHPLFLYVSYTAAHTPLQPEPEWLEECGHIPHLWRRQYCGMMVGLDKAVSNLLESAGNILGKNTVVVVTSDNGGSVWFGGLNAPLRSGKLTPFEGGVRVPGFVVDLSSNFVKTGGGSLTHMIHISDWLPTFLSWAGSSHLVSGLFLDGLDQSEALKHNKEVRTEILLELFTEKESHDQSQSSAFRRGKYKLILGNIRDPHWYSEPTTDRVATSDRSFFVWCIETFIRLLESMFGNGPIDVPWDIAINMGLFGRYAALEGQQVLLFDIEKDPQEKNDISKDHADIVKELIEEIEKLKLMRPAHPRYWMMSPNWTEGFLEGDCEGAGKSWEGECRFAHHWLPDEADVLDEEGLGLEDAFQMIIREDGPKLVSGALVVSFIIYFGCRKILSKTKMKQN